MSVIARLATGCDGNVDPVSWEIVNQNALPRVEQNAQQFFVCISLWCLASLQRAHGSPLREAVCRFRGGD